MSFLPFSSFFLLFLPPCSAHGKSARNGERSETLREKRVEGERERLHPHPAFLYTHSPSISTPAHLPTAPPPHPTSKTLSWCFALPIFSQKGGKSNMKKTQHGASFLSFCSFMLCYVSLSLSHSLACSRTQFFILSVSTYTITHTITGIIGNFFNQTMSLPHDFLPSPLLYIYPILPFLVYPCMALSVPPSLILSFISSYPSIPPTPPASLTTLFPLISLSKHLHLI